MSDPYVGEIRMLGFNFAPYGWSLCQGQTLPITQNQALFAVIGTYFGGNGTTTFQLPNMQSRVPVGMGQGPGLSLYNIGQAAGVEAVTLTTSTMPSHTHAAVFTPSGGGTAGTAAAVQVLSTATPTALSATPAQGSLLANTGPTGPNQPKIYAPAGTTGTMVNLGGVSGGGGTSGGGTVVNTATGGNQPFQILQPYLSVNFSIALNGIFPTRG